MGKGKSGPEHSQWKGGRTRATTGYVLVWAPGHHLAYGHDYAFEHRMVAEKKIGRRLLPSEHVHHLNGIKTDNRPENLEVMPTEAHHHALHRTNPSSNRRLPDEPNPEIDCACGCGAKLLKYDWDNRPRRFVAGHRAKRGGDAGP